MTSASSVSPYAYADENYKEDAYERLRKLRHELAELRSHCHSESSERVRQLEDLCQSKERYILTLSELYQKSQEEIAILRGMLHNNNDHIPPSAICPCSNTIVTPELVKSNAVEGLQALERRALDAERRAHSLNQELTRKAIEVNKLQLLYTMQAVRLMELSKERFEETQRLSRQVSERSVSCFAHPALSSTSTI